MLLPGFQVSFNYSFVIFSFYNISGRSKSLYYLNYREVYVIPPSSLNVVLKQVVTVYIISSSPQWTLGLELVVKMQ